MKSAPKCIAPIFNTLRYPWISACFSKSSNIFISSSFSENAQHTTYYILHGFAPIFPDTCYHLTHYWPAAADIPV
ncbi:hypothetical protein CI694_15675, partial [Escherichia coli]